MGILYLLTIIMLGTGFILFKKSEEKQNIIKWIVIFLVSLLGYNTTICMILGLLKVTSYLWLLSIINLIFAVVLGYKAIKNKDCQKYYVKKQDIVGLIVFLTIFIVIVAKDIKPFDGGLKYGAIDSAIHFRAAKHFSDNLMVFINVEDKTIFDFNVMQTGAYINDGLFMNVVNGITGLEHYYIYEMFEISVLLLSGLAFYVLIFERIKNKLGFVLSMIILGLYMYAYPYNSYMYGFSYLSVAVAIVTMIVTVVQMLYEKEKINTHLLITIICMLAMGLIFSYCLFVPIVFAAICIYTFMKDFKEEGKTYLKIFKKKTLILTGILLLITFLGIAYLVVPTFFIEGQTNLADALTNQGGIYKALYQNFVFYIPFGIIYIIHLVKTIRKKTEIKFLDVFSIVTGIGFIVMYVAMQLGYSSDYYFYKIYNLLWIAIVAITVNLINEYSDKKIFGKAICVYVIAFLILVIGTITLKASTLLGEEKKQSLPNYVGIYFAENCQFKGLINAYNNFAKEQIEVVEFMKTIDDLTADNITLISGSNYERSWTTAIADLRSTEIKYNKIIEDANEYTIQSGLDNENTKYIVRVNESYDLDEFEDTSSFVVLFKNSRGYVLKKK